MILNIKKVLEAVNNPINDPWTHYIVDDILNYDFTYESSFVFDHDTFFQLIGELEYYRHEILKTYNPIRLRENAQGEPREEVKNTWARVNWLTEPPYVDREIHMDNINKIWTCVIYCHPVDNTGTVLIEADGSTVAKEIEWKQNRALIFSPGNSNQPTWHKIINSTNKTRRAIALNIQTNNDKLKVPYYVYDRDQQL